MKWRGWLLLGVIAALIALALFLPRIPQSENYHHFADQRAFLGVPNCLNVLSNVLFLIVGAFGLRRIFGTSAKGESSFIDPRERWPWFVFFAAVALTAFGSGYYHLHPNDQTLVWDRLPMAIGFMALLDAVFAERVNVAKGLWLLIPLLAIGAASVLWWNFTQENGAGDLRPYALVQFGSLIVLLLLIGIYPPKYSHGRDLIISLAIYGLAKIFEAADRPIFALGHIVSGHTLKHIAAAFSAWWLARMLARRNPVPVQIA